MIFASDNWSAACPEVLEAVASVPPGPAYGLDDLTASLDRRFSELFEREVRAFPVSSGTAANALALSVLTPPWGWVLCHESSHVMVDEAGAPELLSGGARLVGLRGPGGKITIAEMRHVLEHEGHGVHSSEPSALTLTQATEAGTVYQPTEIRELADCAHSCGLAVHLDGARLANAVVSLGCTPADTTWRAGVDVLSFGATKNGAIDVDAVIFFDERLVGDFERQRKRSGHLLSKMRYLSAQLHAYLDGDLWLRNASHANAMARRLSEGLTSRGLELVGPVQANEIFVRMPSGIASTLLAAGVVFHTRREGEGVVARLVTSWASTAKEVDGFLGLVDDALEAGRG